MHFAVLQHALFALDFFEQHIAEPVLLISLVARVEAKILDFAELPGLEVEPEACVS